MILIIIFFSLIAVLAYVIEDEKDTNGVITTLALILYAVASYLIDKQYFKGIVNFFTHLNWLIFVLYITAGLCWSFFKWYLYVKKTYNKELLHAEACHYSKETRADRLLELQNTLTLKNHYPRIGTWIWWWPISILNYVISDLFTHISNYLTFLFSGIYNKIVRSIFK